MWISLAGLPLAAQPRCAPVPAGLSAWFTFDEPLFRPLRVAGKVGSAIRFNGKDQYVEVPASTPGLDMGEDDFTIELWIRTTVSSGNFSIVDKRDQSPRGYLIPIYNGQAVFQVADGGKGVSAFSLQLRIADGRWHHVAGVAKRLPPQPLSIYVDGIATPGWALAPLENLDVPAPLWLGRHHPNKLATATNYFQGEIDELSFYRRALTPAEIQAIFRAGSAGKCR